MVGTLAQLIALVSHGNAFLADGYDLRNFYPSNSTFQFCNEISFVDVKKFYRVKEKEIAATPDHWFAYLKESNCRRLSLWCAPTSNPQLPDHISVAFVGGGGDWYIRSGFINHADYWLGRWEVTDQNAPDNRIWKVTYVKVSAKQKLPNLQVGDLSARKAKLEGVLKEIGAFALKHDLHLFATCFQNGLEALSSDDPIALTDHKDLLPGTGYTLEAKQLIAAASQAWVLGGMGSWNDLGFADQMEHKEYERLSEELYAAIKLCIEKGVNSYTA